MLTVWVGGPWACLTLMLNLTVYVLPSLADLTARVVLMVPVAAEAGTLPLRILSPDRDESIQVDLGSVETLVQESALFLKNRVRSISKGAPMYTVWSGAAGDGLMTMLNVTRYFSLFDL